MSWVFFPIYFFLPIIIFLSMMFSIFIGIFSLLKVVRFAIMFRLQITANFSKTVGNLFNKIMGKVVLFSLDIDVLDSLLLFA
jgi:hypothetical protein